MNPGYLRNVRSTFDGRTPDALLQSGELHTAVAELLEQVAESEDRIVTLEGRRDRWDLAGSEALRILAALEHGVGYCLATPRADGIEILHRELAEASVLLRNATGLALGPA
jgi:hypothetical protein